MSTKTDNLSDLLVRSVSDLLMGETPAQRVVAARSLGRIRSRAAVRYLIQALTDEAPDVRLAAAENLAEIGDAAAIEPLKKLLEKETSVNKAGLQKAID